MCGSGTVFLIKLQSKYQLGMSASLKLEDLSTSWHSHRRRPRFLDGYWKETSVPGPFHRAAGVASPRENDPSSRKNKVEVTLSFYNLHFTVVLHYIYHVLLVGRWSLSIAHREN